MSLQRSLDSIAKELQPVTPMNQQNKTERWEERIKFRDTPYEIEIDEKPVDDLNQLYDFISQLLSDARREALIEVRNWSIKQNKSYEPKDKNEAIYQGGYSFAITDLQVFLDQALTTAEESIKNLK